MNIFGMVIFLAVWLLILWIGSIALEATGLDRSRSRFQALSALSGTGFTTSQAESIVEHPKRRSIVSYLIFIGNTGIIALILLVIVYARAGIELPSVTTIVIAVAILLVICLIIWLGLIDKLTNAILKLTGKEHGIAPKILYQTGDYAVARLFIDKSADIAGLSLKDTGLLQQDITMLAIERSGTILSQPESEEKLLAGDSLLCYGKIVNINSVIPR